MCLSISFFILMCAWFGIGIGLDWTVLHSWFVEALQEVKVRRFLVLNGGGYTHWDLVF